MNGDYIQVKFGLPYFAVLFGAAHTPELKLYQMGLGARNLSSGLPTKGVSNQSPQLQRLSSELKFPL